MNKKFKKFSSIALSLVMASSTFGNVMAVEANTQEIQGNNVYINDYFKQINTNYTTSNKNIQWEQFAPGNSGYSEAVFTHPTDADVIFNFPDMFNSYRSIDGGASWHTVLNEDLPCNNLDQISRVHGLDFSRQNPNFGMTVGLTGLWVTSDKGASWDRVDVDPESELLRDFLSWQNAKNVALSAISVDPNDDNIWYIGSGNYWEVKANSTNAQKLNGAMPENPGKFYKSTDKGQTWSEITTTGINPKATFSKILVNKNDSNLVFASTSYGLYKSIDGGMTFSQVTSIEEGDGEKFDLVRDLESYYNPETGALSLYIIRQIRYEIDEAGNISSLGGIMKSDDLGKTWVDITGNMGMNIEALAEASPATANYINGWFFSPGRAMGKYLKGVASFADSDKDKDIYRERILPTNYIHNFHKIEVDPTDPNRIFVSSNSSHDSSMFIGDVWATKDGGSSWYIASRVGKGWEDDKAYWESIGQPTDVNIETNHFGDVYNNEVYTTQSARDLDMDVDGNLYLMTRALVKSTDHGDTWQNIDASQTSAGHWVTNGNSNLPGGYIVTDQRDQDLMFFISGENRFFKLMDDGDEIREGGVALKYMQGAPESPSNIAICPSDINTMYMLVLRQKHHGEFLKSTDGGETWNVISAEPIFKAKSIYDSVFQPTILINPDNINEIYMTIPAMPIVETGGGNFQPGVIENGVYKSLDGGVTWNLHTEGLPLANASAYDMEIDPKDSKNIYVGITAGPTVGGMPDMANQGALTLVGEQDEKNNVTAGRSNNQNCTIIQGSGIGFEKIATGLQPNTTYSFASISSVDKGETSELFVKDTNGNIMSSVIFSNDITESNSMQFTTGPNQTEVVVGGFKASGEGTAYYDFFAIRAIGGLFKATTDGSGWDKVTTLPKEIIAITDITIDRNNGNIYITAGEKSCRPDEGGVWVSEDNGETWKKIFEAPFVAATTVDPNNSNRIMTAVKFGTSNYFNYNLGVFLSEDAGQTWDKINTGLGNNAQIYDLSFDPNPENVNTIWATSNAGGFYKGTITRDASNPIPEANVSVK